MRSCVLLYLGGVVLRAVQCWAGSGLGWVIPALQRRQLTIIHIHQREILARATVSYDMVWHGYGKAYNIMAWYGTACYGA